MEAQIRDLLLLPYDNGSVSIATEDIQIIRICEERRPADKTPTPPPTVKPRTIQNCTKLKSSERLAVAVSCRELQARKCADQEGAVQVARHRRGPERDPQLPQEP